MEDTSTRIPDEATLRFVLEHRDADVRSLALRGVPAGVDLHAALTQIEGHQLARHKLPTWSQTEGILWPVRLSLEQCSSDITATYKRQLVARLLASQTPPSPSFPSPLSPLSSPSFPSPLSPLSSPSSSPCARCVRNGSSFADLTAGFGVDFAALAPLFAHATYVEQQASLCALARHNFPLLGLKQAEIRHATAEEVLQERITAERQTQSRTDSALPSQYDTVFAPPYTLLLLDPARRDAAGRKVALLEDCTPNVVVLKEQLLTAARHVLLKLSPMLDITAAVNALAPVTEVHVVAVSGECKELLVVMGNHLSSAEEWSLSKVPIHCVDLTVTSPCNSDHASPLIFTRSEEASSPLPLASALGPYLFEPNAALLKAGAYRLLCQRYGVEKLAPSTHLYTSDHPVPDFPGRQWHVVASTTFSKRELRAFLTRIPAADLTTRGFPLSAEQLRHQLHLRAGGGAHLVATTLADGKRVLCQVDRC